MALIVPAKQLRRLRKRAQSISPKSVGSRRRSHADSLTTCDSADRSSNSSFLSTSSSTTTSVLVLGAAGRTGSACIRQLAKLVDDNPCRIHAFCRNPAKLGSVERQYCEHVVKGDARCPFYLEAALELTRADVVIVSIGNGDCLEETDVRTKSALALANVLQQDSRFSHVRVIAVSDARSVCAAESLWERTGLAHRQRRRHICKDHFGQEQALLHISEQCTVVRATTLTTGAASGSGAASFVAVEKAPTTSLDREDLARWIAEEAISGEYRGRAVNLTAAATKQHRRSSLSSMFT